jgi:MFS family permease
MTDSTIIPAQATVQKRLGPVILSPGYGVKQVVSFLFVTCICVSMNEFANIMQPLVLGGQLHLAPHQQGLLAGMLGATQQTGTLIFILAAGALADIFGRRVMLIYTLLGFAVCLAAYPFVSSVTALFALRAVWGVSFTGYNAGAPAIAMDIPDNRSRGKFNSLVLLIPWLAASGFVLATSRLPAWIASLGYGRHEALIGAFGLVALVPLVGVATTAAFFKEPKRLPKANASPGVFKKIGGVFANIREVLAYAGQNKKFGLILFIGSVVRTDTVIIGSFLGLWIVNAGRVGGVDALVAAKTAGLIASIRFVSKVIGAPLFGLLTDKINRVAMMLLALAMMTAAFGYFGFVTNVFSQMMLIGAALIGFSESAEAIASQSLIAQEAPEALRGSSVGVFTFLGTGSLMVVNLLGGYLFDRLGFSSPLVMEGAFHLLVLIIAIVLLLRSRTPGAAR